MKPIENTFQEFVDAIQTAGDANAFERVAARLTQNLGFQRFAYLRLIGDDALLISSYPRSWTSRYFLYGAIHVSKAAAPYLEKAGDGRIIAMVGDSSRVGESGLAIVAAARAGVIGLMKSLAGEFGRFGATANTISLGLIETSHDRAWVEANRDKLTKFYPLRRLAQPHDIAPMVTLLASPHAAGSQAR